MTDIKSLVELLRAGVAKGGMCDSAADLIEQQAEALKGTAVIAEAAGAEIRALKARIAELEAHIAAGGAEPWRAGDDLTITGIPARIYLNLGDIYEMGGITFQSLTDVTWCEDRIDETDIEYVRAIAAENKAL